MKPPLLSRLFLMLLLAGGVSCQKVPITGRKQLKLLPESTLINTSATHYRQIIAAGPVDNTSVQAQLVKEVGAKISAAVNSYMRSHKQTERLKGISWEFNVINKSEVNAFCMPGGKVVFYTGIFPYTQDANGIATVMGHEIAHAIARHGNERVSQQLAVQTGLTSIELALSQKPRETNELILQGIGMGASVGVILPFSRLHETEADKLGLVFMAMAGYDPAKAVDFWKRMSQSGGSKPPELLSTHPSDATRIKNLQAYLPKARKYYKP